MRERIKAWLRRAAVTQTALGIAWVLAVAAVGLGFALALGPPSAASLQTFALAYSVAPPVVWGVMWVVLGSWLAVKLAVEPPLHPASRPLYLLAIVTAAWGALAVAGVALSGGAAAAVISYVASAAIALICGVAIEKGCEPDA